MSAYSGSFKHGDRHRIRTEPILNERQGKHGIPFRQPQDRLRPNNFVGIPRCLKQCFPDSRSVGIFRPEKENRPIPI